MKDKIIKALFEFGCLGCSLGAFQQVVGAIVYQYLNDTSFQGALAQRPDYVFGFGLWAVAGCVLAMIGDDYNDKHKI